MDVPLSDSLPSISVVIPVRNESSFIQDTLTQLAGQDYPSELFEVIVVDGDSTDDTAELARKKIAELARSTWQVLPNPKRLASAARNIGVARSRGDYILIIDGHVHLPSPSLLSAAAHAIRTTGAEILGRPQRLIPPNISQFQASVAAVRGSRIGHGRGSLIYSDVEGWAAPNSIAVMYHRSLFERFGTFDESFDAAEDYEFNSRLARAGLRCWTSPSLEVLYYPRSDYRSLFRQMQRYGMGRTRFLLRHRDAVSIDAVVPAAAVATVVAAALCAPFSATARFALGLISGMYVLVVLASTCLPTRPGFAEVWRRLLIAATIHCGLGWGAIREGARSTMTHNTSRTEPVA